MSANARLEFRLGGAIAGLVALTIGLKIVFQTVVYAPTLEAQLVPMSRVLETRGYETLVVEAMRPQLLARKGACMLTVIPVGAEGASSAFLRAGMNETDSLVYVFRGHLYPDRPPRWEPIARQQIDKLLRAMHLPSTFPAIYRATYGNACAPTDDLMAASAPPQDGSLLARFGL